MAAHSDRRIALVPLLDGAVAAIEFSDADDEIDRQTLSAEDFPGWVHDAENEPQGAPRWILGSARELYPRLLAAGITLTRSYDLTLCHAILRDTTAVPRPLAPNLDWIAELPSEERAPALFEVQPASRADPIARVLEQYRAQRAVLATVKDGRLALLCAAESAGGLLAEEMRAGGLPWDAREHDRILTEMLGPRPAGGGTPAGMTALAEVVRARIGDPTLNLDSQQKLLRALHRIGVNAESTSRWELAEYDHPVIEPLVAYRKMSRLLSANGWAWLAEWVRDNRFRPIYIPGGVVTGRWASAGGGALQLPRMLRPAVRADPGWTLIVADVAQLEPRMLAAMSRDLRMAEAARGQDLYAGIVSSGAVATREEAKFAVLGAMYGATSGASGRLVPKLRKVYPLAMGAVDAAARVGEDGGIVSTWLGRCSPRPDPGWEALQSHASADGAAQTEVARARQVARNRGRFTRNFIVQGTAAEWSMIWLAEIRHRLTALPATNSPAPASGPFARRAHLAFFLHDEVILHVPAELAEQAADAVREAAAVATTRLFGSFPIDVPLDLRIASTAEK